MAEKKNKLVVFDWGGIVFNLQKGNSAVNIWKRVLKKLSINADTEVLRGIRSREFDMTTSDTGKVDADVAKVLQKAGAQNIDHAMIKKARLIMDAEVRKAPMHRKVNAYIKSLIASDRCYTAVLSNLSVFYAPALCTHLPVSAFDYVWFSFEIGAVKPNDEIYAFAEKHSGIKPENILFFDDGEQNIAAAKARGWHACLIDESMPEGKRCAYIRDTVDNFLNGSENI